MPEIEPPALVRFAELVADVRRRQRRIFDQVATGEDLLDLRDEEKRLDHARAWITRHRREAGPELANLADAVGLMREWQTRFIQGDRTSSTIRAAKKAEAIVDQLVGDVLNPQPSLFAPEGPPR